MQDRVMCECMSFLIRNIILKTCHDCRRVLLSLYARIESFQLHFASPEVNLFDFARLQNPNVTARPDDLAYLRASRRMGACMPAGRPPAKRKISSQMSGKFGVRGIASDLNILAVPRRSIIETPGQDSLKGAFKKMCTNGASKVACLFTQQGRKGINQDAMIVWEGCGALDDTILCGVFDGHGPFGHLVAQNVRDSLPSKLVSSWQAIKGATENARVDKFGKENSNTDCDMKVELEAFSFWKQSFLNGYKLMDKELRMNPTVDCFWSGTTAVTFIKQGDDVIIGNVGDSRAVLGTKSDDGSILAVQLTVDLKPNLPQEAERIRQCKGRVFALHDEPEVHRVWLPHENSPGLAMSRAFGDFCLKNFGVIAVPEVSYRHLTDKDQFIVLATDGIWDVLSNEQVVEIVSLVSARQLAARAVVDTAVHVWRSKYPTSKVDDCAVVCLYVDKVLNVSGISESNQIDLPLSNSLKYVAGSQTLNSNIASKESKSVFSSQQNPAAGVDKQNKADFAGNSSQQNPVTGVDEQNIADFAGNSSQQNPVTGVDEQNIADSAQGSAVEDEWSALEGVSRLNSLVNLPRFSIRDKKT